MSDSNNGRTCNYKIGQFGCGVVGGGILEALLEMGCKVFGIEVSRELINKYREKKIEMYHIEDDLSHVKDVDFLMLSVPTPLKGKKLDLSYLYKTIPNVATILTNNPDALVIVRSTVRPSTCALYKKQLTAVLGKEPMVLFQPEFLRAATAKQDAKKPWHVVLGVDKKDLEKEQIKKLIDLYKHTVDHDERKISLCSVEEAEMQKMIHNSFNAMKISFFNQCHLLVQEINKQHGLEIDINKITAIIAQTCEGIRNPKYGTKAGHGYYGTCLPKDSAELADLEETYGLKSKLFKEVVEVNNEICKTDKEPVLVGDFQMSHTEF